MRWYLEAASKEMWSVRTLDRNISTQYYERHYVQPKPQNKAQKPNKFELLKILSLQSFSASNKIVPTLKPTLRQQLSAIYKTL